MYRYVDKELTFTPIIKRALRLHYVTLKHTIPFIICITVIKYLAVMLTSLIGNNVISDFLYVVTAFILAYFFSMALLAAHRAFIDKPLATMEAVRTITRRLFPIFATFVCYVLGAMIVYTVADLAMRGVDHLVGDRTSTAYMTTVLIAFALMMVFVGMFYFSYPLTVISEKGWRKAFFDSAILSERVKFNVLILIMILAAAVLLLTPGSIGEYILSSYHLELVFDFVVLCVLMPLYINLMLLTIHAGKQQAGIE